MASRPLRGLGDGGEPAFNFQAPGANRPAPPPLAEIGGARTPNFQAVREVAFNGWSGYAFVIGITPIQLDLPNILMRGRRAVLVVNSHVANVVWLGHSAGVAVNNGIPVGPNYGAISIPLSEYAQVWAVSSGAATVVALGQFL